MITLPVAIAGASEHGSIETRKIAASNRLRTIEGSIAMLDYAKMPVSPLQIAPSTGGGVSEGEGRL